MSEEMIVLTFADLEELEGKDNALVDEFLRKWEEIHGYKPQLKDALGSIVYHRTWKLDGITSDALGKIVCRTADSAFIPKSQYARDWLGDGIRHYANKILGKGNTSLRQQDSRKRLGSMAMSVPDNLIPPPEALKGRDRAPEDQSGGIVALWTAQPVFKHPRLSLPIGKQSSVPQGHASVVMSADLSAYPAVDMAVIEIGPVFPLAHTDNGERPIPSTTVLNVTVTLNETHDSTPFLNTIILPIWSNDNVYIYQLATTYKSQTSGVPPFMIQMIIKSSGEKGASHGTQAQQGRSRQGQVGQRWQQARLGQVGRRFCLGTDAWGGLHHHHSAVQEPGEPGSQAARHDRGRDQARRQGACPVHEDRRDRYQPAQRSQVNYLTKSMYVVSAKARRWKVRQTRLPDQMWSLTHPTNEFMKCIVTRTGRKYWCSCLQHYCEGACRHVDIVKEHVKERNDSKPTASK